VNFCRKNQRVKQLTGCYRIEFNMDISEINKNDLPQEVELALLAEQKQDQAKPNFGARLIRKFGSKKKKKGESAEAEPAVEVELSVKQGDVLPFYIGSVATTSTNKKEVTNKYSNEPYCSVCLAEEKHIDEAIGLAEASLPAMAALKSYERKQILMNVAEQAKLRAEELAQLLCIEAGKPIADARGEVTRLITTFEIAAEEATRLYGEYQPLDVNAKTAGQSGIVRRFPIGVCSFISPFNFPLNLVAHKVAPAIAAGCPFVLKPASKTPLGALILGDILMNDPLLPKGAFSIVPSTRAAAEALTTDERFKLLSFTGSPVVGWKLKEKAGKKKVVLELGGNAACVVDELVPDMDSVLTKVVSGGYYQSGQSCISVQRLFVNSEFYEEFRDRLVDKVTELKSGDPLDPETFIGPVISTNDAERIMKWIKDAESGGAKILCGGTATGSMVEATLVENVPHDCLLYSEEVFGPVIAIEKYDGNDFKGVIDLVNDSQYGLQAGIFTNNMNKAFYAFENLEVGGVVINHTPSIRSDPQPYGGVKASGLGREGLRYAIEDMTEPRIMLLNNVGQL